MYWTVSIYYGGNGPTDEVFRTKDDAMAFYNSHNQCNTPKAFIPQSYDQTEWAEHKIAMRESEE